MVSVAIRSSLSLRIPRLVLDRAVEEFSKASAMFVHNSLPSLNPLPSDKLPRCHHAGRCVCKGPGRHLGMFEERLVLVIKAHCPKPRRKTDVVAPGRLTLRYGSLVVRVFHTAEDATEIDWWFHVAYTNLSAFSMSWVRLFPSTDAAHLRRAPPPLVALMVPPDCAWTDTWEAVSTLDLGKIWHCDLYSLTGSIQVLTDGLAPNLLQVRRLSPESSVVWSGFL